MYLNDAFDAEIDARQRPERPIPSGAACRGRRCSCAGFADAGGKRCSGSARVGMLERHRPLAGAAALALAAAIVLYNWHHKENPLGPLVMGLCRVLVYVAAALCVTAARCRPRSGSARRFSSAI